MPEKNKTECDNDYACCYRARKFRTRGARTRHLRKKTPTAQRPTPNVELGRAAHHLAFFSAVLILATKIRINSSTSLRHAGRPAIGPNLFKRPARRSQLLVSRSSFRQIRNLLTTSFRH